MNKFDEYSNSSNFKRDEFILEIEKSEKDYRKINRKEIKKFLDKKLGEIGIRKDVQKDRKNDLLITYDFNSFNPSAQIEENNTWLKIETAYPFRKHMSVAVCSSFNCGNWNELK